MYNKKKKREIEEQQNEMGEKNKNPHLVGHHGHAAGLHGDGGRGLGAEGHAAGGEGGALHNDGGGGDGGHFC